MDPTEQRAWDTLLEAGGFDASIVPSDPGERRAALARLQRIARMAPDEALEAANEYRARALAGGTDRLRNVATAMFARSIASAGEGDGVALPLGGTVNSTGQQPVDLPRRPGAPVPTPVGHGTRAKAYRAVATAAQARGADEYTRIAALDTAARALAFQTRSPARTYTAEQRAEDEHRLEALQAERDALGQRLSHRGDHVPKQRLY